MLEMKSGYCRYATAKVLVSANDDVGGITQLNFLIWQFRDPSIACTVALVSLGDHLLAVALKLSC